MFIVGHVLTNRYKSFHNSTAIETGISDFHKMIVTVLRSSFKKGPPKIILYRDDCYYSHSNFRWDVESHCSLNEICNISNDKFVEVFMNIVEHHAPINQKVNHAPINQKVNHAPINQKVNHAPDLSREVYNKQRNYCTC